MKKMSMYVILSILFCLLITCPCLPQTTQEEAKEKAKKDAIENLSKKTQGIWICAERRSGLGKINEKIIQKASFHVLTICETKVEMIDTEKGWVLGKASIQRGDIVKSLEESIQRELTAEEFQDIKFLFSETEYEYGYAYFSETGEKIVSAIQEAKMSATVKLASRLGGEVIEEVTKTKNFIINEEQRQILLKETLLIGCGYSKPEITNKIVYVQAQIKIPLYAHSLATQLEKMGFRLSQNDYMDIVRLFKSCESDRGQAVIK